MVEAIEFKWQIIIAHHDCKENPHPGANFIEAQLDKPCFTANRRDSLARLLEIREAVEKDTLQLQGEFRQTEGLNQRLPIHVVIVAEINRRCP